MVRPRYYRDDVRCSNRATGRIRNGCQRSAGVSSAPCWLEECLQPSSVPEMVWIAVRAALRRKFSYVVPFSGTGRPVGRWRPVPPAIGIGPSCACGNWTAGSDSV